MPEVMVVSFTWTITMDQNEEWLRHASALPELHKAYQHTQCKIMTFEDLSGGTEIKQATVTPWHEKFHL